MHISVAAALVTALIGALVLFGWATEIEILTTLLPGQIVMLPNCAVAFVLAGISLWLQRPAADGATSAAPSYLLLARLCGGAVLAIGFLIFVERMLEWNLGIDLLLFPDEVRRYPYQPLGRIATNSTVALMLAGAGLLLVDRESKRGIRPSQSLALLGLTVSALALTGYLYDAPRLYSVDRSAGMALITALTFAALQIGIFFARPARGLASLVTGSDLGALLVRRLLLATIVAPLAMGWLWIKGRSIELFSQQGGVALFVLLTIGVLVTFVIQSGRALRAIDGERAKLLDRETDARASAQALANEAQQARAEAEEASKAKSSFLATMSHELRTPLNAVIGYASLLGDEITGPLNDGQKRQIERIGVSARHLLALIDEVLTLSRLEAGKEQLVTGPVRVASAVDDAASIIEPLATGKGLDFRAEWPAEDVVISSDAGKVRQILLNLLANAVKFTERGEVTLRARANDGVVAFEVHDTGIGIAPRDLERVFEPFWQVEANVARRVPGTGLGLGVSRQLAHRLGGEVTVESEIGRGSTFTLSLPREGPARRPGDGSHV